MVGVLMAAGPAGVVVGTFLLGGFVAHERRLRLMRPLAVAASAALIGCLMQPALAVTLVLWFCAGLGMSYQLAANAAFVSVVPAPVRARAFGVAQYGLHVGQDLAIVVGGAAAQFVGPATTVGLAGGLGAAAIAAIRPRPVPHVSSEVSPWRRLVAAAYTHRAEKPMSPRPFRGRRRTGHPPGDTKAHTGDHPCRTKQ